MRKWAKYAMVVLWLCYGYPMVMLWLSYGLVSMTAR